MVNFGAGYLAVFAGIFFAITAGASWASLGFGLLLGSALGVVMYWLRSSSPSEPVPHTRLWLSRPWASA